ncbi:2-oxoglutarate and iron-dependent oxygenase domain-containing protein 2 [Halocaridina rubra]|uniref:2-oxoglutarate and iron-dependent oxygenase domain-containing protein 2 n=1 Tax=Halocaridina rubra TaxID=373956 RepID=A0AAN8XAN9_HALRR
MLSTRFHVCQCYFTSNLFIKKYNQHITYINKEQFLLDYTEILKSKGCIDPTAVIPELETEILRRKKFHQDSWERRMKIAKEYKPLNPHIFTLQKGYLDPKFVELVKYASDPNATYEDLVKEIRCYQERIYTFPVFTKEFCNLLVNEIINFEESPLPKGRPNTMNRYGVSLGELGFDKFLTELRNVYITPLTRILYPDWGGASLDSNKAFIVKYEEDKDTDLDSHFDNAEITLNVPLNDNYLDGELYFGPMRTEESSRVTGIGHQMGIGLLHLGQQIHGALPISEGVRYNLILWMRSSQVRNQLCPMCDKKPTLVPVENGFGDGFTITEADVCSVT